VPVTVLALWHARDSERLIEAVGFAGLALLALGLLLLTLARLG
jgi:hypothetical protein